MVCIRLPPAIASGRRRSSRRSRNYCRSDRHEIRVTYQPDFYDAVTPASFAGDTEWYRSKARESGGPVLELGAGTGRITLALAQDGVRVHALDAHAAMLAALRAKLSAEPPEVRDRVVVVEADMRSFELPQRFPL